MLLEAMLEFGHLLVQRSGLNYYVRRVLHFSMGTQKKTRQKPCLHEVCIQTGQTYDKLMDLYITQNLIVKKKQIRASTAIRPHNKFSGFLKLWEVLNFYW